jgi:hypothetical protein
MKITLPSAGHRISSSFKVVLRSGSLKKYILKIKNIKNIRDRDKKTYFNVLSPI